MRPVLYLATAGVALTGAVVLLVTGHAIAAGALVIAGIVVEAGLWFDAPAPWERGPEPEDVWAPRDPDSKWEATTGGMPGLGG